VLAGASEVSEERLELAARLRGGGQEVVARIIASEQVRQAYAQAWTVVIAGALLAAILVVTTGPIVPQSVSATWALAVLAATLVAWWVVHAYTARTHSLDESPGWQQRWILLMLVLGSVWGAAGVLIPDAGKPETVVFVLAILCGMAASAIHVQAGLFRGFLAFVLPGLMPITLWLLHQDERLYVSMGIFSAAYGGVLTILASYHRDSIRRSLRVGVENMGLVHELVDANEVAQDTNRALESEIEERAQTEEALRRSEEHFRNLIRGSLQGIALIQDWRVVFANESYARMLGYDSVDDVIGANVVEDLTPERYRAETYDIVRNRFRGREGPTTYEGKALTRGGEEAFIEFSLQQVNWYGKRTTQITATDITERARAESALRQSEERFKDFAETAADWFFEMDETLSYTYVSERFEQISGWTAREIVGMTQREFLRNSIEDPDKLDRHYRELDERRSFQVDLLSAGKDGNLHVFHYSGKPIFDNAGRFLGYRGAGRDVTQAFQLSKQLSYQATHDALTGLLNRRAFEQRLERVLNTARHDGSTHALCYLDLDQFKVINDTCGHMAGDELLRQLGRLLPTYIRKRDTIARLGGDEFGVLMEHCSLAQAERVARALCRAVEEFQYVWEDRTFRVGCSIGLVPISDSSDSAQTAMSSADTACYAAKDKGRRRVHVYHPGDEELAKRYGEMQWAVRINRALEDNRFRLVYQPITPVHLPSAERQLSLLRRDENLPPEDGLHFELLIRLEEYDGTFAPPGAFLPAAERYNLSSQLDRWVCDTAFDWLAAHPDVMNRVSVCAINLSGHSLGDASLLDHLTRRFDNGEINPRRICFEVTETAAIANLAAATRFIQILGERGCQFALDDFGSGLSSFAYLKTLPVHYLKIDGVFVKDIADDPIDLAMVKSINEIGQVMGKKTVAEFVENDAILAKLKDIGVNYAQGYGIARPRPIETLLESVPISAAAG